MGQKVNSNGIRLSIINTWNSLWFADKADYTNYLHQDLKIRAMIIKSLVNAGLGKIKIERFVKKIKIIISVSKPGVVLGKKGEDIQKIKKNIENLTNMDVAIDIAEIKRADLDPIISAASIAYQLENHISYKKAMKKAIQAALKSGAKGIKIKISGRLGGAEIARDEGYKEGRVPLHTLRANVKYATASAYTTYGVIGIKVWIYLGDRKDIEY